MSDGRPSSARASKGYVLGVTVLGAGILAWAVTDVIRHPVGLPWLFLVALTLLSGWATLRIPAMPISFSISDTFIMASALLFGPAAGAITAALDGLVLSYRMAFSTRTLGRVLFNIATLAIATWVAAQAYFALAGSHSLLDGPLAALRHLVGLLAHDPINPPLAAGEIVTTGTLTRAMPVKPGETWSTALHGIPLDGIRLRFA